MLRWIDGAHVVGATLILAGALVGALVARKERGEGLAETVATFFRSLP